MTNRRLPSKPSLEHLKKQAKALVKQIKVGEADALATVAAYFGPEVRIGVKRAQLVIAREYGFDSWQKLKAHVSRPSSSGSLSKDLEATLQQGLNEARGKRHEFTTVEHLLLALIDNSSAVKVLKGGRRPRKAAQGSARVYRLHHTHNPRQ